MARFITVHRMTVISEGGFMGEKEIELLVNVNRISRIEPEYLDDGTSIVCMYMDTGASFYVGESFEDLKCKMAEYLEQYK